ARTLAAMGAVRPCGGGSASRARNRVSRRRGAAGITRGLGRPGEPAAGTGGYAFGLAWRPAGGADADRDGGSARRPADLPGSGLAPLVRGRPRTPAGARRQRLSVLVHYRERDGALGHRERRDHPACLFYASHAPGPVTRDGRRTHRGAGAEPLLGAAGTAVGPRDVLRRRWGSGRRSGVHGGRCHRPPGWMGRLFASQLSGRLREVIAGNDDLFGVEL